MSVWNTYEARIENYGKTGKERALQQTQSYISRKIKNSLSCHDVLINGIKQTVTIINQRENMSIKKICSLPGEHLIHGGLVDFANSKWLITEVDANDEVYTSALMERCNYVLKWLNDNGDIVEKWCVVEDGTKYLIGEKYEDIMSVGDARIAVTIGKDDDTIRLRRGMRFLIDDISSNQVLAYKITKPNRLFNIYNDRGVFRFIMNEVNLTDDDNVELRIADYYNWKPKINLDNEHKDRDKSIGEIILNKPIANTSDDKEVWI